MTPPAADEDSAADDVPPMLTVAAVARRLGVAPATLRTWARRYHLGPSEHTAGAHRRYSAADLGRLVVMRRLTLQGVPPADASKVAVNTVMHAEGASVLAMVVSSLAGAGVAAEPADAEAMFGLVSGALAAAGPAGGGRVLAQPDAGPAERGLARAAMALDGDACVRILRDAILVSDVPTAYESLVLPVLSAVGRRWETTGAGVDVEHMLSESVLAVLRSLPTPEPASGAVALLACAEEEQHSVPLHVLGAALAERRVGVRVLGARVPREALTAAVRRLGPAVVFVFATMPVLDPSQLDAVPRIRPAPRVVVGGPGWDGVELHAGTGSRPLHITSLAEAVREITLSAG